MSNEKETKRVSFPVAIVTCFSWLRSWPSIPDLKWIWGSALSTVTVFILVLLAMVIVALCWI